MKRSFLPLQFALISPAHLQRVRAGAPEINLAKLGRRAAGEDDKENDWQPWWMTEDIFGAPLPAPGRNGSTAIIPVKGVITSGLHPIYRAIWYADTDEIAGWVQAAADDPEISRIILQIDSPGGMCCGTPELAAVVAAAGLRKSVLAHTSGMMASAAYWIGSQAHEVYCTPSADVGCIGVYQVHYDFTAYLEEWGVSAEIFKSGDLKATGHPDIPLTDAMRADIQKSIDLIGVDFRAAVTSKRTLVEPDSMRGQAFLGTEAAQRNLVAGLRSFASLL